MRQVKVKLLRKTLLSKTTEILLLVREHFGDRTKNVENPQNVWRQVKRLYTMGKIPQSILKMEKENK